MNPKKTLLTVETSMTDKPAPYADLISAFPELFGVGGSKRKELENREGVNN